MQDKLTRAIKVMHGWHKLSGILGGKIYPRKVHLSHSVISISAEMQMQTKNKIMKKSLNIYQGSVYWQTVTVCQLQVIGRPFTKYVNVLPISSCWQTPDVLYKRATITALFKRLRQCASADKYFLHGLPIISYWQTVTVCQ